MASRSVRQCWSAALKTTMTELRRLLKILKSRPLCAGFFRLIFTGNLVRTMRPDQDLQGAPRRRSTAPVTSIRRRGAPARTAATVAQPTCPARATVNANHAVPRTPSPRSALISATWWSRPSPCSTSSSASPSAGSVASTCTMPLVSLACGLNCWRRLRRRGRHAGRGIRVRSGPAVKAGERCPGGQPSQSARQPGMAHPEAVSRMVFLTASDERSNKKGLRRFAATGALLLRETFRGNGQPQAPTWSTPTDAIAANWPRHPGGRHAITTMMRRVGARVTPAHAYARAAVSSRQRAPLATQGPTPVRGGPAVSVRQVDRTASWSPPGRKVGPGRPGGRLSGPAPPEPGGGRPSGPRHFGDPAPG